jgi:uncharacterized protein YjiS (DUF1127 family)
MPTWMYAILSKGLNWLAERQQRCTIRELQRLDQRTLIDIGLDPDEIEYIARSLDRGLRGRERRRAVIVKSSLGIMAAGSRVFGRTPPPFRQRAA